MNTTELHKIAETWIRLYYLPEGSKERDESFWAYSRVHDLCEEEPETCWQLIHAIRRIDSSDVILANLATGPLEDLLVTHGEQFIDRVEKIAETDQQFRKLLGAIWKNEMADSIWSRIKTVAAPSW